MISNQILSIILVTYNSSELIKSSLEALKSNSNFKIYVDDNASNDDTISIIKKNFPDIEILISPKNMGFSRANNMALKIVKTKFSLILNVDARITQEDILKTLKIMEQNPNIAMAGNIVHNCKYENNLIKDIVPCQKNLLQLNGLQNNEFYINKFITGAGMFLNMEIMKKIGFFDEGFFLYCEDNEICKRVQKNGFQTAIIKDTALIHIGGNSSKTTPQEMKKIYWHRFGWSKLYYSEKIYNKFIANIKAIRMIIKFSLTILFEYIKTQKISAIHSQGLKGSFAYLIGLKAFDKSDNPRG